MGVGFSIRVSDAFVRQRMLARRGAAVAGIREFLTRAGQLGVREMRNFGKENFHKRQEHTIGPAGGFVGSVRAHRVSELTVAVQPNVPYSVFVDQPTRAHIIRPKNKKALHWRTQFVTTRAIELPGGVQRGTKTLRSGAISHFAQEVHHPGTKGHFVILKTARRLAPQLPRLAEETILRRVVNP